ncbi:MAG: DUF1499 domain-containing protein [bacterium]|nr:DUF1499 domain-containing protein [bacterium]
MKFVVIVNILSICLVVAISLTSCSGKNPGILGVKDEKLSACPDSPNCVSSQAPDKVHLIKALSYSGTQEEAHKKIIEIVKSMKRTVVITTEGNYIHAEFTSAVFRFVDDVEFFLNDSTKEIHVRSASRIGYSDMGVNRKRIEEIRNKLKI